MPREPCAAQSARASTPHDHGACVTDCLARAEAVCAQTGRELTPVRRRALEILLEAHEALGAYDVLARLTESGLGRQPPVAYRALAFLTEAGLAHRIERLNAYIACTHPGQRHDPAFLICRDCGTVAEAEADRPVVEAGGFAVEGTVVEAVGLCPACQP